MKTLIRGLVLGTALFIPYAALAQAPHGTAPTTLNGATVSGAPWERAVDPEATPGARNLLAEMADLYTIDLYGSFAQTYYDTLLSLAKNKPIAFAEVGTMPTLDTFARQPRWSYFMMWSGMAEHSNAPALLQTNFHAVRLLTLDSPLLAPWQPTPAPSNPDSKESAQ